MLGSEEPLTPAEFWLVSLGYLFLGLFGLLALYVILR